MYKLLLFLALVIICLFPSCKKDEITNIIKVKTDTLVTLSGSDYRPAYHFTPSSNWMNDPNGLVCYKGEFHLFYQYNPAAIVWGPMNWGHAVSTDLFNWQDLPIALTPDNLGTIFSGSAVVDSTNTSGFQTGSESPLVAVFTENGSQQIQSIAYSNDKGRSWIKYANNPVLPNPGIADFRDPKAFWYPDQNKWVMAVTYGSSINIYSSVDLKNWTLMSNFNSLEGITDECPDLYQLPVEGTNIKKWVLMYSGGNHTKYFIGDFDGTTFTASTSSISYVDYGPDNYAGNTYNDIASSDGRRIFIGWMNNWNYAGLVPATTWRCSMTVPRVITLVQNGQNYSLSFNPVAELENYKTQTTTLPQSQNSISLTHNGIIKSGSYELTLTADFSQADSLQFTLGDSIENLVILFDKTLGKVSIDRSNTGNAFFYNGFRQVIVYPSFMTGTNQQSDIRMLFDKTSVEVFWNQGQGVMSALYFPYYQYNYLKIKGSGSGQVISNFSLSGLSNSLKR
jgi:fructan beta-fructosidase